MLLMRSGSKFLCVILALMASRGVVWMPPETPAPVKKSRYFLSRPAEIDERALGPVRETTIDRRGLALVEASGITLANGLPIDQASSTQRRRRRRIITGRCPQAAPDAPRATRAAAARRSTHRCTSPHPAPQRRDSCRRRPPSRRTAPTAPAARDAHSAAHAQPPPLENRHYA